MTTKAGFLIAGALLLTNKWTWGAGIFFLVTAMTMPDH